MVLLLESVFHAGCSGATGTASSASKRAEGRELSIRIFRIETATYFYGCQSSVFYSL